MVRGFIVNRDAANLGNFPKIPNGQHLWVGDFFGHLPNPFTHCHQKWAKSSDPLLNKKIMNFGPSRNRSEIEKMAKSRGRSRKSIKNYQHFFVQNQKLGLASDV